MLEEKLWKEIWKRVQLKRMARKLQALRHKAIPVFGVGGTGKSTFADFLRCSSPPTDRDYSESWATETAWLGDGVKCRFEILPGQDYRGGTWEEHLQRISEGQIRLSVNVCAYGLHDRAISSIAETPLHQWLTEHSDGKGVSIRDYLHVYRQARLQMECDGIKKVADHFCLIDPTKLRAPVNFLTIANKLDLYWQDRDKARAFYNDDTHSFLDESGLAFISETQDRDPEEISKPGAYAREVGRMERHLGNRFSHRFVQVALVRKNLHTDKESIAITDPSFRSAEQFNRLESLAKEIENHAFKS